MVDTEASAMGAIIDNQKVSIYRSISPMCFGWHCLYPEVVAAFASGDQFNRASGFRINGGRANQNQVMFDLKFNLDCERFSKNE